MWGILFINPYSSLKCEKCGRIYNFKEGIIEMLPREMLLNKEWENIDKLTEMEFRDSQANDYDKKVSGLYSDLLNKLILNYLDIGKEDKSKAVLLDLGCGTGRLEKLLHNKYKFIFAVDFSIESLKKIAEKNYKNVFLIQADVNQLPFNKELFNEICMADFFQHIPTFYLREKLLSNIKTISKNGAKIILTSYNYNKKKAKEKLIYKKSENIIGEPGKIGYHANSIYYYNYHYSELIPLVNQFFEVKNCFGFYLNFPLYLRIFRKLLGFIKIDHVTFESKYYFRGKDVEWGNRLFVYAINKKC